MRRELARHGEFAATVEQIAEVNEKICEARPVAGTGVPGAGGRKGGLFSALAQEKAAEIGRLAAEATRTLGCGDAGMEAAGAVIRAGMDKLYAAIDGTGVPVTAKETVGRDGKSEDGRARTREVKLGVFFTQDEVDDKGYPIRDQDSSSYIGVRLAGAGSGGGWLVAGPLPRYPPLTCTYDAHPRRG